MAEVITQEVRIQAVAKELNVSWTHLIETLQKKGFNVDSKPTIKISREMHDVLLKEFQQDLVDKKQAEKIAFSPISLGLLLGTVALAFGVNLVEFFCSAGFPAIYTKILSMNNLSIAGYYLFILLYVFLFMLDDIIVFLVAAVTLSKVSFTEQYSKWSLLIGGIFIFLIGLLLVLKPELLMFA